MYQHKVNINQQCAQGKSLGANKQGFDEHLRGICRQQIADASCE